MRFVFVVMAVLALTSYSAFGLSKSLQVHINSANDYCLILPSTKKTIGESEDGGNGAKSFCTKPVGSQGKLPTSSDAWKNGPNYLKKNTYVQITGCMRTSKFSTLVKGDGGGQYDSNGGLDGKGNPRYSICKGYKSYVELVEPDSGRVCLRCCNDNKYCRLDRDTQGCAAVIRNGNYNGC